MSSLPTHTVDIDAGGGFICVFFSMGLSLRVIRLDSSISSLFLFPFSTIIVFLDHFRWKIELDIGCVFHQNVSFLGSS